jgi:predicted MFS family arabinose efflux permease
MLTVPVLATLTWGWRDAFLVTGLGALIMLSVCLLLRPVTPKPAQGRFTGLRTGVPQH